MGNGGRLSSASRRAASPTHQHQHQQLAQPPDSTGAVHCAAPDAKSATREPDARWLADARESPGKITHGFWLQQYTWLHNANQAGVGLAEPRARTEEQPSARRRLLARWNDLKRTLGGSACEVSSASQRDEPSAANRLQSRSLAASRLATPGGECANESTLAAPARSPRPRRRRWFARELPATSGDVQGRSRSSCLLDRSAPDQRGAKSASPYRQIARVFSRPPGDPAADHRQRKLKRQSQRESGNELDGDGDESGAGAGGILRALFAHSPLFRRRKRRLVSPGGHATATAPTPSRGDERRPSAAVGGLQSGDANWRQASGTEAKSRSSGLQVASRGQEVATGDERNYANELSSEMRPADATGDHNLESGSGEHSAHRRLAERRRDRDRAPSIKSQLELAASGEAPPPTTTTITSQVERFEREMQESWARGSEITAAGELAPVSDGGRSSAVATPPTTTCALPSERDSDQRRAPSDGRDSVAAASGTSSKTTAPDARQDSLKFASLSPTSPRAVPRVTSACRVIENLNSPPPDELAERQDRAQLLQLIQPLGSSNSSVGSSSICFELCGGGAGGDANLLPAESSSQQIELAGASAAPDDAEWAVPSDPEAHRPSSQPAADTSPQSRASPRRQPAAGQAPSSGVGLLRDNFKKLVKRQQSVDSYRMARELKRKQRQQSESRQKHQSNEAIKQSHEQVTTSQSHQIGSERKFSMKAAPFLTSERRPLKIYVDSDEQRSGTRAKFALNVNDADDESEPSKSTEFGGRKSSDCSGSGRDTSAKDNQKSSSSSSGQQPSGSDQRPPPTPPNTLSLMPGPHVASAGGVHHGGLGAGAVPYMLGTFSGCITPTYPTHHLPSPKYVSPNVKKYSNASTISSSIACDSVAHASGAPGLGRQNGSGAAGATTSAAADTTTATTNPSDTESSIGIGSATPSRGARGLLGATMSSPLANAGSRRNLLGLSAGGESEDAGEAAAAARRANLAEHIYDNKCGLGEDMKFLASLPELCDITFLVGETREPVCAVKSVLAARSRVFHKILFGGNRVRRFARQQRQEEPVEQSADTQEPAGLAAPTRAESRRGSSPKQPKSALATKASSPLGRSSSPQQQAHWSVTSDASGYNAATPFSEADPNAAGTRSGRVSVASGGRDSSVGQVSLGSQQPLIIGPGQTAAPIAHKRNKKSSIREVAAAAMAAGSGNAHPGGGSATSRLSRMFMKRASDPSLKRQQSHSHELSREQSSQSYLDKMSSSQMSTTMIIEEFEPDVFRQLIEYIHTGCVLLQARTLLGLLNAADYYGLEQLRRACLRFVSCCITVDTVCSLLSTAERYIQYKCTKSIVQKVLEFVDSHADEIFKLNAFGLLPEHVVRLILARDGLKADEYVKYNGVYTWCEHYCRSYELTNIADVMRNFLDLIQFHKIPTGVLLGEIYPTHIVPDTIFLSALACQADPQNFEPPPARQRRMTLPNPTLHKGNFSDDDAEDDARADDQSPVEHARVQSRSSVQVEAPKSSAKELRRRRSGNQKGSGLSPSLDGSREQLVELARSSSRKSRPEMTAASSPATKRKGSLAQVSISGVMRLSHKLSIRRKQHNRRQSVGKQQSLVPTGSRHHGGRRSVLSQSQDGRADPMAVGQQILDAYLVAQRKRELEEEERLRREHLERQAALEEAKRASGQLTNGAGEGSSGQHQAPVIESGQQSGRKSFRDFKHISRRLFMRHSSKKLIQQSASSLSPEASSSRRQHPGASRQSSDSYGAGAQTPKRRNLFKIKRSETVYESSPSANPPAPPSRPASPATKLTHHLSSTLIGSGSAGQHSHHK